MTNYELNAEAFEKLQSQFADVTLSGLSESDTRGKFITRILVDCLGWPDTIPNIRREEHVHAGFIDYTLNSSGHGLILEAKSTGISFHIPSNFSSVRNLSVKNLLMRQPDLKDMYAQVTKYAHERGISYCVLTNGIQWIVFPGVRTDNIHIRQSRVILFVGLDDIASRFVDFWGLLSFESVATGSLDRKLLDSHIPVEPSFVFNTENRLNIPYDRNPLALVLEEILPRYFGDLHGDPLHTEMLEACYVSDSPVQDTPVPIRPMRADEVPSTSLESEGRVLHFYSLHDVSNRLFAHIESFLLRRQARYLQVILGRVGIGKTTFLSYFFDVHHQDLSKNHFVVRLDFRGITESTDLDYFFFDSAWDLMASHPGFTALTARSTLRKILRDDVSVLDSSFSKFKNDRPDEYELEMDRHLMRILTDRPRFLEKLSQFLYRDNIMRFILVFDNVDQLPMELQEKVIRFAYAKAERFNASLILSMWEETYLASKRGSRVLATIKTVPLQVARQSTTSVLVKRLEYLQRQIRADAEPLDDLDLNFCSKEQFIAFINLILRSLLVDNKRVREFLELVAIGNIRHALEMFQEFLTAGSLETPKILSAMLENESYLVPVHEFVKSVMLGSKRFYSAGQSPILNVFAIGDQEHPSHFTRLRMLQWLYERRHEASPFGQGFHDIDTLIRYLGGVGITAKDATNSIYAMTNNAIIENDLRAIRDLSAVHAIRITPTGRYYLLKLHRMFAYIDLVMQDTPIFERDTFDRIAELSLKIDMPSRFIRCETFLDYLQNQEEEELLTIEKLGTEVTWRERFVPRMRRKYLATKKIIERKGYA
jgi:hypothetical protein